MYRQKFSCEICHKTFTRKYSLSRHYKEVHQGESRSSKFQCKSILKTTTTISYNLYDIKSYVNSFRSITTSNRTNCNWSKPIAQRFWCTKSQSRTICKSKSFNWSRYFLIIVRLMTHKLWLSYRGTYLGYLRCENWRPESRRRRY